MANKITKLNLLGTDFDILSNIPDYTTNEHYPINAVVVNDGSIFRAKVNIPAAPATFQPAQWDQIGGGVAIIVYVDQDNNTWTSTATWDELKSAIGSKSIFFVYSTLSPGYTLEANCVKYSSGPNRIDCSAYLPRYGGGHAHYEYNYYLLQDGTVGYPTSASDGKFWLANGNSDGYAKQTVGTLTVEDANHSTIGTFNGSENKTFTLPEGFTTLTTAEIDTIWSNA